MKNSSTLWLLLGLYEGRFYLPLEQVVKDYFAHLDTAKFVGKVNSGEIRLPIITAENSQRSAKMIDLRDLAEFLDCRRQEAQDRLNKLHK